MAARFSVIAKLRTARSDNLDGVAACQFSLPDGLKKKQATFKWGVPMHKWAADGARLAQASAFLPQPPPAWLHVLPC